MTSEERLPVRVVTRGGKRVEIVPAGRGIFRLYLYQELPGGRRSDHGLQPRIQYGGNLKGAEAYAKDMLERPESRRG